MAEINNEQDRNHIHEQARKPFIEIKKYEEGLNELRYNIGAFHYK